ncbi:MAG: endonuclease/exonuclease/phosphatase family protein [Candidatus Eremiobacterota bacterium]
MKSIIRLLSCAYLAGILLLPLIWKLRGELQPALAFTRLAPPIFYAAPLMALALAAVLLRHKSCAPPLVLCGLVLAFVYADLTLHFPPAKRGSIRVVCWNILSGISGPDRVGAYLQTLQPDLILLQECSRPGFRPGPDPLPGILNQLPGYSWQRAGAGGELAVLSRYPVDNPRRLELGSDKPAQLVDVHLPGGTVSVLNLHFSHGAHFGDDRFLELTAWARHTQTDHLVRAMDPLVGPLLVAGDFNSPPGSASHAAVAARLRDAYRSAGLGFGLTYPSRFPIWRIDHVFASRHFAVRRCTPLKTRLSDHRPVYAELDWNL